MMRMTRRFYDTNMAPFHKDLSEYWSEEVEYVFQRIKICKKRKKQIHQLDLTLVMVYTEMLYFVDINEIITRIIIID